MYVNVYAVLFLVLSRDNIHSITYILIHIYLVLMNSMVCFV